MRNGSKSRMHIFVCPGVKCQPIGRVEDFDFHHRIDPVDFHERMVDPVFHQLTNAPAFETFLFCVFFKF